MSKEVVDPKEEIDQLLVKFPYLTEKEARELRFHVKTKQPSLGVKKAEELQNLFNRGYSCQEISEHNKGISLGQVVRARADFDWDNKRQEYIINLMREAKPTLQATQYEALRFLTDAMAVHHKMWGEKFRKYLQTGTESELAGFELSGRQYKEMFEMLLKATGQDKSIIIHEHKGSVDVVQKAAILVPMDRPIEAGESRNVLKQLIEGKKLAKTEEE